MFDQLIWYTVMHCDNCNNMIWIYNNLISAIWKECAEKRSYCIKAYNDNDETSNQAQTLNVYVHDQLSAPKFGGNVYFGSHVRGSYHSWARDKHFSLARCPGEDLRLSIYHASKIKWCINYQHKLKMKTADHLSSSLPAVLKQYVPEYEPTVPV